MDRAEATRVVPALAGDVRAVFWDIEAWYRVWDRITTIEVPYDDGRHQEFVMEVERDGCIERVRTVRFLDEGGDIGFFSPAPPPSMDLHRGSWSFGDAPEGCSVVAVREYQLTRRPGEEDTAYRGRRDTYREGFELRLGQILDRFADHFADQVSTRVQASEERTDGQGPAHSRR